MYWPVGTPRIYATSSSPPASTKITISHDGLPIPSPGQDSEKTDKNSLLTVDSASSLDVPIPGTPLTPHTPAIRPVEHNLFDTATSGSTGGDGDANESTKIPLKDPILALRVSRTGQVFGVITATSMTIWQAKVRTTILNPAIGVQRSVCADFFFFFLARSPQSF